MATSGPNPAVYAKMTPAKAWEKLSNAANARYLETGIFPDQLWLLRESNTDGCLTVSYINHSDNEKYSGGHMRYILLLEGEEFKWESVSKLTESQIQEQFIDTKKMVFMNMDAIKEEKYYDICKSLFDMINEKQLLASNYLEPSIQECSRNQHYEYISSANCIRVQLEQCNEEAEVEEIIKSAEAVVSKLEEKAETECPITRDCIGDGSAVILNTRHLYNAEAANQWLVSQGSDPLTRERIASRDVLRTNVCQKAKVESERLKEVIAGKRRENTEKSEPSNEKPRI